MSVAYEQLLPHIAPFIIVLSRLGGLMLFAPLLSSPTLPRQVKIFLLLSLTVVVYPTIDFEAHAHVNLDLFELAPIMMTEMIIGAALGIFASIPFVGVQLGGLIMGQQMGLGIAQIVNPGADIEGDSLG
ncbi:MAG: flagellar biosynthetic protein FliR, partial [Planctomycetota bacterium]